MYLNCWTMLDANAIAALISSSVYCEYAGFKLTTDDQYSTCGPSCDNISGARSERNTAQLSTRHACSLKSFAVDGRRNVNTVALACVSFNTAKLSPGTNSSAFNKSVK